MSAVRAASSSRVRRRSRSSRPSSSRAARSCRYDRLGAGHPDAAQCLVVGGEELRRRGHPAARERLEPGEDRRRGRERELLADHLQHERSPQVARQAVEQTVGVQARFRVDQFRHPRVRRAQQRPPGSPTGRRRLAPDRAGPRALLTGAAPGRPRPGACRRADRGSAAAAGDRRSSTRRTRSGRPARAGSSACPAGSVARRRTAIRASRARAAGRRGRGASPRCTRSRPCRRI